MEIYHIKLEEKKEKEHDRKAVVEEEIKLKHHSKQYYEE